MVGHHLRLLFYRTMEESILRDVLVCFVAIFLINLFEDYRISGENDDRYRFDSNPKIFFVVFEVSSAIGNVGLSMGATSPSKMDAGYAFSYDLSHWSRLVIVCMMLYGRSRGLPSSVDSVLERREEVNESDLFRTSFLESLNNDRPTGMQTGQEQGVLTQALLNDENEETGAGPRYSALGVVSE